MQQTRVWETLSASLEHLRYSRFKGRSVQVKQRSAEGKALRGGFRKDASDCPTCAFQAEGTAGRERQPGSPATTRAGKARNGFRKPEMTDTPTRRSERSAKGTSALLILSSRALSFPPQPPRRCRESRRRRPRLQQRRLLEAAAQRGSLPGRDNPPTLTSRRVVPAPSCRGGDAKTTEAFPKRWKDRRAALAKG